MQKEVLSEQEQLPEILIKLLRNVPVTSLARDGRKVLGFVFFNNGICISGPELRQSEANGSGTYRSRQVVGQLLSHINFNLFGLNCFVITEQLRIHRLVLLLDREGGRRHTGKKVTLNSSESLVTVVRDSLTPAGVWRLSAKTT